MDIINIGKRTIGGIAPGASAKVDKKEGEKLLILYSKEIKSASSVKEDKVDNTGLKDLEAENKQIKDENNLLKEETKHLKDANKLLEDEKADLELKLEEALKNFSKIEKDLEAAIKAGKELEGETITIGDQNPAKKAPAK